ncbi:MAG TPA: sulfatase [Planctomycetaceae bacterium]|nr:sulfatase [Planctomycetaceae bacterium]
MITNLLKRIPLAVSFAVGLATGLGQGLTQAADLPNILWITSEDNGPELGCYGDEYSDTPNIDALAAAGMKYKTCWSNAPVCAPARTTIISGMFPTSFGGQHMRSQVHLPDVAKLYPEVLRELGYYCTNNSKEDYNLHKPKTLWDESSKNAHWRNRNGDQPFFAVFNFTISHESKLRTRPHKAIHDASEVFVPPYHPDTPEVRQDWAQYYDKLTEMDTQVGEVMDQLREDGLADSTIIFYYGDHGSGMPRGKRWLYQSGLHVPLIVSVPQKYQSLVEGQYTAGSTSDRLVSFVDLMPTVLSLGGMQPPEHLHGKAFLGPYATEDPQYIYGFRDRMDERYDMSRAIRDSKFMYIRNFYPQRPQGAYLDYMFKTPTTRVWKELFDAGKLDPAQAFFWSPKPSEELYDTDADPYQVNNLAESPEHKDVLERMRTATRDWMFRVRDVGFFPEGLMLQLADGGSPYDLAQDSERYPLEQIYEVADLATRPAAGSLKDLLKHQVSPSAIKRFWVANGLLIRGMQGKNTDRIVASARGMMGDTSPYVQAIAAETMARFGNQAERAVAMELLTALASADDMFVVMTAMNSLDWCKPTRSELGTALDGRSEMAPKASRYKSYIPNLVKRLESIAQ